MRSSSCACSASRARPRPRERQPRFDLVRPLLASSGRDARRAAARASPAAERSASSGTIVLGVAQIGRGVLDDAAQRSRMSARCAASTSRTRGSSGQPAEVQAPRDAHASEVALERPRKTAGSDGSTAGSRGSGPAITLISRATSATVRASGPLTAKPRNGSAFGAVGTSPTVGRKPTTLLKLPGFLSEPPMSLPSAIGSMPRRERRGRAAARAAARSSSDRTD